MTDTLLTIPEVMTRLSVSRSKMQQMINEKQIPIIRIGRCVRVSEKALEQWIAKQAASAREQEAVHA